MVFFYASSCEHGWFEFFGFGFVLDFLVLLVLGFAVQILVGSFSLVSLIHKLAVSLTNISEKRQDRGSLWSKITARFYDNRSKNLRTGVRMSEMADGGSIFTFLKGYLPFIYVYPLTCSQNSQLAIPAFLCASFLAQ